jgi:hypothetical protein
VIFEPLRRHLGLVFRELASHKESVVEEWTTTDVRTNNSTCPEKGWLRRLWAAETSSPV